MRPHLQQLIDKHLEDPDPLNLSRELAMARALLEDYLARAKPTPGTYNPVAMKLVEDVAGIVAKIERIRAQDAISIPAMHRIMAEMARIVAAFISDPVALQKIREAWLTIRLV